MWNLRTRIARLRSINARATFSEFWLSFSFSFACISMVWMCAHTRALVCMCVFVYAFYWSELFRSKDDYRNTINTQIHARTLYVLIICSSFVFRLCFDFPFQLNFALFIPLIPQNVRLSSSVFFFFPIFFTCACANSNVQSHKLIKISNESDVELVRSIDLWITIPRIRNINFQLWIELKIYVRRRKNKCEWNWIHKSSFSTFSITLFDPSFTSFSPSC